MAIGLAHHLRHGASRRDVSLRNPNALEVRFNECVKVLFAIENPSPNSVALYLSRCGKLPKLALAASEFDSSGSGCVRFFNLPVFCRWLFGAHVSFPLVMNDALRRTCDAYTHPHETRVFERRKTLLCRIQNDSSTGEQSRTLAKCLRNDAKKKTEAFLKLGFLRFEKP